MKNNKFQTPAVIQGISTLKDRTLKLTVYVSKEIAGEEKTKLFDLEQKEGWFLFSENSFQEKDIPKEQAIIEKDRKTLSERLYNVMFVYHSQNFSDNFQEWRIKEMEKIIQAYKEKLI